MNKTFTTLTLALLVAAPALAAGDAAWDGAMHTTIRDIAAKNSGTAVPADAAAFNRHFGCFATGFFGSLQLEVEQVPPPHRAYVDLSETGKVVVRLQGIEADRAAQALGMPAADSLQAVIPEHWCQFSAATPGVFSCELPNWQWPRPVLNVQAFDAAGNRLADRAVGVLKIGVEKTMRTAAGNGSDIQNPFLELDASLISEADNAARAQLHLPYEPQDCRAK